jgi:DNA-binding response OmpR family regulator
MEPRTVLSLSTDPDPAILRERARVLQNSGFKVISVTSPSQAQLEITMGRCGIFIACPMLSDLSTAALFKIFKQYCPDGLSVFVISDETRSSLYRQQADIQVHESDGPNGIVAAILAHLELHSNDLADTA